MAKVSMSVPLPVANYAATIRLRHEPGEPGGVVERSSEFTPSGAPDADAVTVVRGIYQAGRDNLRKPFGV